jgi:hypothetical protein
MGDFLGMPDDVARLALQRLLQCDVRARSHRRAARLWQRASIFLSGASAISAALAAWAVAKSFPTTAIILSLCAAVFSAAQSALAANDKMERHRSAANGYESISHELDSYLNLEVGPPMWRGKLDSLESLPTTLSALESKIDQTSSRAPAVSMSQRAIEQAKARANAIVEYLQMPNVTIPPSQIWAD